MASSAIGWAGGLLALGVALVFLILVYALDKISKRAQRMENERDRAKDEKELSSATPDELVDSAYDAGVFRRKPPRDSG